MERVSTREQILESAEAMFLNKGLRNSTIAEIAAMAGVTDSVIYHHFKNKEDLLFSIIGNYLKDALNQLTEHMAGILEPLSQLSKIIWFHLTYNINHLEYSQLLLFECRSNKNFYQHPSYEYIRKWAGIMLSVLEQGVRLGVFRENVNMRVMRDIIIGAMDLETIQYLLGWKREINSKNIRDFIAPIRTMIEIETTQNDQEEEKYALILRAAEQTFAQKSYAQSPIAEIARRAGVAEGTVYEYFKNKEQLLLTIPKVRFQEHMDSLREVFEIKTPLRKLRRFIRYHFLLYFSNPDFLNVYLMNIRLNPKFYTSEAYVIYNQYTSIVDQIFDEGKKDGSIHQDVDPAVFKQLLFGGFAHMALRWVLLLDGEKYDKTAEIDEMVRLLLRSVV